MCEKLEQRLATDPISEHLVLSASPTCMKQIGEVSCLHCTYIMSGKEVFVGENDKHLLNGKKASDLTAESLLMPAIESYAPLSTYIINSCKKMNCSDDVTKFKVKLDSLNGIKNVVEQAVTP